MKINNKNNGFTLLELLISICVFIAISGLTLIAFNEYMPKYRLRSATSLLLMDLTKTRYTAVKSNKDYQMLLPGVESNNYEIKEVDSEDIFLTREFSSPEYKGLLIKAQDDPIFHPNGTIENLTGIEVTNGSNSMNITMTVTGRIKNQ